MTTLGVAVIGQGPRKALARTYASFLPAGARVMVRGCMDGLDPRGFRPPVDGADTLYTRLPDGTETRLSKSQVVERAPAALAALRVAGSDVLVFNCTGAFPPIAGDAGVIFPSRLLAGLAAGLVPQGRIGLFVPLEAQRATLEAKWTRPDVEAASVALSPEAEAAETRAAAERLAAARPDLVVFDCMGYRPETRAAAAEALGAPSLLAVTVVAAMIRELAA